MKRALFLSLLAGCTIMFLFSCKANESAGDGEITALHFTYDRYSGNQLYLDVHTDHISVSGADAEITKRIGPANADGGNHTGTLRLTSGQTEELLTILNTYDLEAWSSLPKASSGSSPSCSLIVFSGKKTLYDIPWNAKFPKTVPPQEEIMYVRLFNFFNNILSNTSGWEDVRSDNLENPEDNPAYQPRTVTWFGNEVTLVPGTGTFHEDGSYAEIDYGENNWWMMEGFLGTWSLDPDHPAEDTLSKPESAELTISENGTAVFELNGELWNGTLNSVRIYKGPIGIILKREGETRYGSIDTLQDQSYEQIHITCYPGPVPEPQFDPIDVYLNKNT